MSQCLLWFGSDGVPLGAFDTLSVFDGLGSVRSFEFVNGGILISGMVGGAEGWFEITVSKDVSASKSRIGEVPIAIGRETIFNEWPRPSIEAVTCERRQMYE